MVSSPRSPHHQGTSLSSPPNLRQVEHQSCVIIKLFLLRLVFSIVWLELAIVMALEYSFP